MRADDDTVSGLERDKAGAPDGIISWVDVPSLDLTNLLMKEVDIILATGGPGMVKAAYSSGTPAIGVGAGNASAIIDSTADIVNAVNSIIHSKKMCIRDSKEAFQKAIRSLETGRYGLGFAKDFNKLSKAELLAKLRYPTSERQFIIYEALRKGATIDEIYGLTKIKH